MSKPSEFRYCEDCAADLRYASHKPWCKFAEAESQERTPSKLNKSGLMPAGQAILILPYDPEVKSSALIIPENVKRQLDMVEARGTVIEIGPDAWLNEQTGVRGTPRAKVGDKVLVSKFCGALVRGTLDDVQYRMVNGRDIYATIYAEQSGVRNTDSGRVSIPEQESAA